MIISVEQIKEQLNIDADDNSDNALLGRKVAAAQDHIERLLGFKIAERFGGEDQDPLPAALAEAVSQLAAHWYENREASVVGMSAGALPFGVQDIVREYRDYSFG
ncbi:putative phage protein (predicted DNA packaging) [Agrobacterium larrymoorei]|uniref:Phage protein (Predicted DNA packaging) n=1 Tax=Agrobacterium larrymoorei TaxID=160699 RepID=A0AAJ2ES13_9HYPH|nr:head-tail connector protein [Agrobacterium larrymoorei]MDR6101018.1 putative phage protein (predicted DNA packaging) [Agrobacterium larrymoorei]